MCATAASRSWQPCFGLLLLCLLATRCIANVPSDLTNFQNEYPCDTSTRIVRPQTLDDVAEAVRLHEHVRANGEGHSWNQPFFCAATPNPASGALEAASPSSSSKVAATGRRLLQTPTGSSSTSSSSSSSNAAAASAKLSANIAMTTLRPLNISVNESGPSVWVDAGVKVIDLLEYLGNYVTPAAPAGYTLGAFPWFVYQSIAGAVATGTHGSNIGPHKSLSNQVLALDVILANGTRRVFTNQTDPFLMKAFRVSVGKLGIIGRVQLAIVPEVPVRRSLKALSYRQFLDMVDAAQEAAVAGQPPPVWMNETQLFWLPQTQQFMMVGFTRADNPDPQEAQQALAGFQPDNSTVFTKKGDLLALGELVLPADAQVNVKESQVLLTPPAAGASARDTQPYAAAQRWVGGFLASTINGPLPAAATDAPGSAARTAGVPWTVPKHKPLAAAYVVPNAANNMMAISAAGIGLVAANLSSEPNDIYIKQPSNSLITIRNVAYDQYEVSIPLTTAGDCWRKVLTVVHGGDLEGTNTTQRMTDKGFRTAPLIRFIGSEDGLLSHTHDGPRMYINIEDYVFYNANRTINQPFKAVMAVLTGDPACTAKGPPRLHWGKAGWPDKGCWHGDKVYGDNWCHFGCAVRQLDPNGKFADSAPDRWTWAGVDLGKCCGTSGFKAGTPGCECKVQHARSMADCPPAPFYTSR